MCVVFIYFGRSLDSIKHIPLFHEGTKIVFGIGEFSNVEQLMEHFQNYPIIGGESGFDILYNYTALTSVLGECHPLRKVDHPLNHSLQ